MRLHPEERVSEYTKAGWWGTDTWDSLLTDRAAERPERVAVVDQEGQRWTWAELEDRVGRLASGLRKAGVGAEDVVGVQLPNGLELTQALLAVARIGAVSSPFPVSFRQHELSQLGELLGMTLLIDGDNVAQLTNGTAVAADASLHPNDCVTICWTSGTEAVPKGVPRCANDWLAIARVTASGVQLSADDVLLNPFPMVNMAGIGGMFLPWLLTGSVLVQHQPFDLVRFLQQVAAERVTYTVAPPALLTMLLANEDILQKADLSSLRVIGSGSAPLSPSMVRGWKERCGIDVTNFFGSNEGVALLSDPVRVPDPETRARLFPIGAVPGVETRLVDVQTGEEIRAAGRPGELRVKGPTVFAGYLGQPGVGFDDDGWFCSGDVFELDGEALQYYRFVDRAKDIVIRGGMNISPAEVEGLLAAHPKVGEVAIVGYPDDVLGERACAVVVPVSGADPPTLDELVDFLREKQIASYKLPERLRLEESLPRNPVGKVLKRQLREGMPS